MKKQPDPHNEIERLKAELAAAQAKLAGYEADLEGGGAIAQGDGTTALGAGAMQIVGNVYAGPAPENPARALEIYRQVVMQSTASLPLRGVDVNVSDPSSASAQQPVGLVHVYIDLDTLTLVKKGDGNKPARHDHGHEPEMEEQMAAPLEVSKKTRPLTALEATASSRISVLLGDPGSGKSTFVNFLAYCLAAHGLEPDRSWLDHLPGWPPDKRNLLPLMVALRDFALSHQDMSKDAEVSDLWDFIAGRLKAQNLAAVVDSIQNMLESGGVLLLLDGLDEVTGQEQRVFVRDVVTAFIRRYPKNHYLVTCRVLSYQPPEDVGEPDLRLIGPPDFELAPFSEEKIKLFTQAWHKELARLNIVSSEDAIHLGARLQEALQRPDLQRLAPNPLLLTVMTLVHTHKGRMPDARAMLYEETVDILLWRWEQFKMGGKEQSVHLRKLLLEADRTDVDLKRVLWKLAFEAHKQAAQVSDDTQQMTDIGAMTLHRELASLNKGNLKWAQNIIEVMRIRAGLLVEQSPDIFTFPHRTFQEYLAGAYLASQANFASTAAGMVEEGSQWREVILLAVGKLVYLSGDLDKPLALVGELCPALARPRDARWEKILLAGDVLQEMGASRVQDSVLGQDLYERVRHRLVDLLRHGALIPNERVRAGDMLAGLVDPRFDPDRWYLPREPLMGFVEISAGTFLMGSDLNQDIYAEQFKTKETPQHEVELPRFWMARYPVTVAQFSAFCEDSGYAKKDSWWRNDLANHPVRYVSWHNALAYCEWLNKKLINVSSQLSEKNNLSDQERDFWDGFVNDRLMVMLPNEAEWEKSARGTDGRIYPWGDEFDPKRANIDNTGIGMTSAVGCFPSGASPYGLLDISGNVWEWTRSLWGKDSEIPEFMYPFSNRLEERENISAPDTIMRVTCGGGFGSNRVWVRCAVRDHAYPYIGADILGFRAMVIENYDGQEIGVNNKRSVKTC
jgi:formylglycine-generating enzyme required for sulfatase activity